MALNKPKKGINPGALAILAFVPAYIITWAWEAKYFWAHAMFALTVWVVLAATLTVCFEDND